MNLKDKNINYKEIHPAEAVDLFPKLTEKKRKSLISSFDDEKLSFLLREASYEDKNYILKEIDDSRLESVLDKMSSDEIVDFLGELSIGNAKRVLSLVRSEDTDMIKSLMKHEEGTAGSLMATEYIALREGVKVSEAVEKIREINPRTEMISYIYIVGKKKELVGVIPVRKLFTEDKDTNLKDIMVTEVISVTPKEDREKVARTIMKYDLLAMPVVNNSNKLIGIITLDDIVDVVEEEATEDILKMAGTVTYEEKEEKRSDKLLNTGILGAFKIRFPWLLIALFGGLLAGGIIGFFEETLSAVVALAFFVPVIMDMAGNVGTQSSTIFIRGLALGQIEKKEFMGYLLSEIGTGVLIGLLSGSLVAIIASFWYGAMLGIVIGISMLFSIILATTLGFLIPWVIYSLDFDPATGSNPIITTIKDITSLLIYFSIATLLLGHLL